MLNYRHGKKRLFESEGFHLHFPTELFLGQVRPKICRTTSVCSGESTLEETVAAAAAAATTTLVRPRPRSASVKKEKIRGSTGTINSLSLLALIRARARVRGRVQGGQERDGTNGQAWIRRKNKTRQTRAESVRPPPVLSLFPFTFSSSWARARDRLWSVHAYTRPHVYACAR